MLYNYSPNSSSLIFTLLGKKETVKDIEAAMRSKAPNLSYYAFIYSFILSNANSEFTLRI